MFFTNNRITEYLLQNNYPEFVVQGGINRLLNNWERTVDKELDNNDYLIEEYLNDLDGRNLLAKLIPLLEKNVSDQVGKIAKRIDETFLEKTKDSPCIWGRENEIRNKWTKTEHWWYYRLPKKGQFSGLN